jgi:glutathione synthase/RimK-type ligase-like ATP-grasp enzyme
MGENVTPGGSAAVPALIINGEGLLQAQEHLADDLLDGMQVVFRDIDDLAVHIGPSGVRVHETVDGRDLADFGLVQLLGYQRPTGTLLSAVGDYLASRGVRTVNVTGIGAPTKLYKYVRMANRGLSLPSTVYLPPWLLGSSYAALVAQLDLPFVLKTVTGGKGRMTSLVTGEDVFMQCLRNSAHARLGFLAQELVPPDDSLLVLVLGGHALLASQHHPDAGAPLARCDWLDASLCDLDRLDETARETAERAAASLEYDIAGVHVIRHWTTRQWRVLDVNPNPPLASGRHATDKVRAYSEYLKRRLEAS